MIMILGNMWRVKYIINNYKNVIDNKFIVIATF